MPAVADSNRQHNLTHGFARLEQATKHAFTVLEEVAPAEAKEAKKAVSITLPAESARPATPARPALQRQGTAHRTARILQKGDTFVER